MQTSLPILVVDDAISFPTALAALLSRDGNKVDTAENGNAALLQIQARHYDVILCDLRLPELDGKDFYHLLKNESPGVQRRVIFLTGDILNPMSIEFLEATQHY